MTRSGGENEPVNDGHHGWRDSADEWALELLKSVPREPANPIRKQRVWLALSRRSGQRTRPLWLGAFRTAIIVCVLGVTAAASATLGQWSGWAVRAYERLVPIASRSTTAAPRAPVVRSAPTSPGVPTPAAAMPALAGPFNAPDPVSVPPLARGRVMPSGQVEASRHLSATPVRAQRRQERHRSDQRSRVAAPAGAAVVIARAPGSDQTTLAPPSETKVSARVSVADVEQTGTATGEDTRPVLAAMRALRREKNAPRARALLHGYLAKHPQGSLAEEALAISIEAAMANRDADASVLGRRYLDRYPGGPFRLLAQQAVNAAKSH